MKLKEASIKLVKAWESLEGGKNYSPEIIGEWLADKMKPAMDDLRKVLNTPKPPIKS